MNLFDMNENTRQLPLASRMRPEKLDEIVGQLHIIGKDKLLYRAIKADRLGSIILYGPPGVGKTTIARVIANTTKSYFCKLNATNAGIKDLEKIIEEAKFNQNAYQKGTILFIDEIYEIIKNDISVKDDINYLLEVGATMNIHIIMSTDSVLDEDINYLFDKDDISKLSFYLTTRREYKKFLDNYIDESLGRDGIYVSTNSTLTRISLPLIEDDEITRVVDNLEVNI